MEDFERAADILLSGGTVIFPTDTVYGLGAVANNDAAVEKLFEIKGRDIKKPINLLIADYEDLLKIAEIPSREEGKLMEKYWPGPLTIILKRKQNVANVAAANGGTIGVRIPDSEIARNLIREVGFPIATTSVNLAGKEPAVKVEDIDEKILDSVDFILDGGECKLKTPSKIVKIENGVVKILRK
ncbi:threonylcarbamoyl-AMP synthase [Candidatus Saccharibacteria bacterium]|nr:threonylcarbamoyl-AMP synthase [Candidatus Saccharibacteria bacterium]